jgi:hypothetical protein
MLSKVIGIGTQGTLFVCFKQETVYHFNFSCPIAQEECHTIYYTFTPLTFLTP